MMCLFYFNDRYEVHEKLQNFMVPVAQGGWHEEQIDELFASLLGKGFEIAEVDDTVEKETERVLDEGLREGFQVFG
jgi:protein AATF/BFR2